MARCSRLFFRIFFSNSRSFSSYCTLRPGPLLRSLLLFFELMMCNGYPALFFRLFSRSPVFLSSLSVGSAFLVYLQFSWFSLRSKSWCGRPRMIPACPIRVSIFTLIFLLSLCFSLALLSQALLGHFLYSEVSWLAFHFFFFSSASCKLFFRCFLLVFLANRRRARLHASGTTNARGFSQKKCLL